MFPMRRHHPPHLLLFPTPFCSQSCQPSPMALQLHSPPLLLHSRRITPSTVTSSSRPHTIPLKPSRLRLPHRRRLAGPVHVGMEETAEVDADADEMTTTQEASAEDLEFIAQIKRVLGLLKKNRDMLLGEVKLTIMIEDPREAERKRLLGIDDDEVTRDDLVAALEDVNEGRIPEDRVALRLLAEEMLQWPNLEVEKTKSKPSRSLYARATDTGIDPQVAAKRLNMDWDTAAEIDSEEETSETEVPQVVGYGALYLVTALPVIIGISVVLILFYNSLQ